MIRWVSGKLRPGSNITVGDLTVADDLGVAGCVGFLLVFESEQTALDFDPVSQVFPILQRPEREPAAVVKRKARSL